MTSIEDLGHARVEPSIATFIESLPTQLYIDGEWRASEGGVMFAVENPATASRLTDVADARPRDARLALDAAVRAQPDWARTPPRDRASILSRAFELVTDRADEFALTMTLEMGKPIAEARGEVAYGAEFLRWFAEQAAHIAGSYAVAPDGNTRLLVHKRPVGPCLLITPWNFPLAMATRKVAPAIAAGCTMVLKPASLTPLTALLLTRTLAEAGLPPGVLNVVPTTSPSETVMPLLADPRVRKLSFTGSTSVGRELLRRSADNVLRTSMELGGNAPFLVFDDADVDQAVKGAVQAKLRNMGEACTAANRFIVHEDVVDEFSDKLAAAMAHLTVGDGTDPGTDIGPLIDEKSRRSVHDLVCDAVEKGATALSGGGLGGGAGYFYLPTVLRGVPETARLLHEEIFGPVAPIITFRYERDAVRLANSTEYGLVAYAYTRDLGRSLRLSESLEVGMLGLNTGLVSNPAAPFGGVKQSGLGREGGDVGLDEYLEISYTAIAHPSGI